jgi:arginase
VALGRSLAKVMGTAGREVGSAVTPIPGGWAAQLAAACADLQRLAEALDSVFETGARPLTVAGRCAASLATLPVVARRHPGAAIVWFDAHGDCNVPTARGGSEFKYLGGMVLTGAAGEWETGLGRGLGLDQVVLVGSRDLDPPERALIDSGAIALVAPGPDLPARLRAAVGGRAVYIHLDCDVLDAGLLATEYQVPGGLSFADLSAAFDLLAQGPVLGLEIAEFEAAWPDGRPNPPDRLIEALGPFLSALRR